MVGVGCDINQGWIHVFLCSFLSPSVNTGAGGVSRWPVLSGVYGRNNL